MVYVVSDLDQLCMKITAGRQKDTEDCLFLTQRLIEQGCTYSMVAERYDFLYGDHVKPKHQLLNRVQKMFKKAKQL